MDSQKLNPHLQEDVDDRSIAKEVHEPKEEEGDANGLMEFIHSFKPTVLMISWCFSTTCDLAMMLRREGVFGNMLATYDLRTITGDPKSAFSSAQQ